LGRYPVKPFSGFITPENSELVSEEAIDLLGKMLTYDKNLRISAKDAMKHEYFDPVRPKLSEP